MIVPYAAGGPLDLPARLLIDRLAAQTKGTFILEHRAGAGGSVGAQAVVQSPPDGSTFLFTTSSITAAPALYPRLGFDPLQALVPVSLITEIPISVSVRANHPLRDLAGLLAQAKAQPDKFTFGSGGVGTGNHLAGELLKKMTGISLLHVPFRGVAPALTALYSGDIDMIFSSAIEALGHARDGRVRVLGMGSAKRMPELPDTPTIGELVPGYVMTNWYGLFAPRGLPAHVLARVTAEIAKVREDPDGRAKGRRRRHDHDPDATRRAARQDGGRGAALEAAHSGAGAQAGLMTMPAGTLSDRIAMYNANALKIGVFGANCSSGRSATKVPERWSASWPDCLALARMADDAGIDFILPIGRWKGYGGDTDFHGATLETMTWACGLLAGDQPHHGVRHRARAAVPSDHRRQGIRHRRPHRRGTLRAQHRRRLERGRVRDVRRQAARPRGALRVRAGMDRHRSAGLGGAGAFDFAGKFFKLAGVRALPEAVRRDAADHHECRLLGHRAGVCAAQLRRLLHRHRRGAHARSQAPPSGCRRSRARRARYGRDIEVFTVGQVICRPTQDEAEDYYHHALIENADWGAIEGMLALRNITPQTCSPEEFAARRRYFAANAIGGYPFVGTPDKVADELATSAARACAASRCRSSTISTNCRISATRCCRALRGWGCARHPDDASPPGNHRAPRVRMCYDASNAKNKGGEFEHLTRIIR